MQTLHIAHGNLLARMPAIDNPLGGMTPSFDFGPAFNTWWKKLVAVVWGLAILAAIVSVILAVGQMRSSDDNPMQHKQGKKALQISGIALVILIGLSPILGLIFYVAG